MVYNTTNVTQANNFYAQVKAINLLSDGYLFSMIMLSIALYFLRKGIIDHSYKDALLGTSFITLVIGILFWGSDLLGIPVITYPVIMLIGAIILKLVP